MSRFVILLICLNYILIKYGTITSLTAGSNKATPLLRHKRYLALNLRSFPGRIEFVRATFLDDAPHGIYASRHPCRPNSIGMSIVELIDIQGTILTVQGIDVLDDTPLLDIKPYMPKFDCFPEASEGWTADKAWREKPPRRE